MQIFLSDWTEGQTVNHIVVAVLAGDMVDIDSDSHCTMSLSKSYLTEDEVVVGKRFDDAHRGYTHLRDGGIFLVGLHAYPVEQLHLFGSLGIFYHGVAAVLCPPYSSGRTPAS